MTDALEHELMSKYNALKAKQNKLCSRRDSLERAIKECDSRLEDCFAAARLFGINLTSSPTDIQQNLGILGNLEDKPTLRDFVLSTLKKQHPAPLKAREIQEQYEFLYGKIHDKTVGMTLYRLSKDGEVVRKGRDWTFSAEDKNGGQHD